VPYYRDLESKGVFSLDNIKSLNDIEQLPILSKEIIRNTPYLFISERFRRRELSPIKTSGTTGKSLTVFVNKESRRQEYAFFSRFKEWAGIDDSQENVTFAGRTIVAPERDKPPFWRYNQKMKNHLFSSYHLSQKNLRDYFEKLKSIQPHFIDSYPSSIYTIAKFMYDNDLSGIHPKAIITSSETLLGFQRDLIETVFGCRIYDQYGAVEQVIFVSQCEHGKYHIHPEFCYVEFLRSDGSHARPGETARLICTGFINKAMPFIRYDIGDTAVLAMDQSCDCGRHFPVIEKIIGRSDDILVMRDGRQVGRLSPVFKVSPSIKEAQVIQEDYDRITLNIVPGQTFEKNHVEAIVYELKKRVGAEANIQIQIMDSIPRTSAGKFRAVISRVQH
jgi:phenylacetate-CoA ligase